MRNADSEPELMAMLAPLGGKLSDLLAHLNRETDSACVGILARQRIIEQDHERVAGETLQRSLMLVDEPANRRMILAQDRHDLFRLGRLGKCREPAKIAEQHGNRTAMAFQHAVTAR